MPPPVTSVQCSYLLIPPSSCCCHLLSPQYSLCNYLFVATPEYHFLIPPSVWHYNIVATIIRLCNHTCGTILQLYHNNTIVPPHSLPLDSTRLYTIPIIFLPLQFTTIPFYQHLIATTTFHKTPERPSTTIPLDSTTTLNLF